jgi:hypothetical protein
MELTFKKGEKVKKKNGDLFLNGARTLTVSFDNGTVVDFEETEINCFSSDLELAEPPFKAGDKIKKKSGETFRNGSKVVTVDRIEDDKDVYFKETGTWIPYKYLELAEPAKQVPTPVVQTFDMLTQKEESLYDKKYELQNKLKEIESQIDIIKTAKEALQKLDLS